MKLHRALAQRPTPRMPELAGFEPRFDAILAAPGVQPAEVVRPLYWWAKDLRRQGYVLRRVHFDVSAMAATVSVRLPSYRVVEVVRRHDDKPHLPYDLPALLTEAVWRLGALGWTDELDELVRLLHNLGLTTPAPRSAAPRTQPIPGLASQPDWAVRVAYWWAAALQARGWRLHACGDEIAQGGFIAEVPGVDGAPVLAVYPGAMLDDGTEASALANHLARLTQGQRQFALRVIADAAAGEGRVV